MTSTMARPAALLLMALAATQVLADLAFPDHLALAVAAKAAADDPGYEACVTAEYQVTECLAALPTTAPTVEEAQCFCCEEDVNVASVFGGCETYIVASAPAYTEEYSVMSIASSFCQSVSLEGFTCGGGASASTSVVPTSAGVSFTSASAGGATRTVVPTASSTAAATFGSSSTSSGDSPPPACTSVESVFESCSSSVRGFATMDDAQAASCICYTHGKYTTAFDNYVADCVPWIKTADPADYTDYYALEGFCGTYKPRGGATASSTAAADSSSPSASSSAPATTKAAKTSHTGASSSTPTPTTTTGTALTLTTGGRTVTLTPVATVTSSTASSPGAHNMASRLFAWLAAVIPLAIL